MLDHCCQSKHPTKVTSKKQSYQKNKQQKWRKWKKWKINKINFFKKEKREINNKKRTTTAIPTTNYVQKMIWPLDVLTRYRYKRTLKVYLTSNWPHVFTSCHRGVEISSTQNQGMEISSTQNFWGITLSTHWWLHQNVKKHQKTQKTEKSINVGFKNVCLSSFVGATHWGPKTSSFELYQGWNQQYTLW